MIPADKILSFLALLEASERMIDLQHGWYSGFHDGRQETVKQVRAYVEAVMANDEPPVKAVA